MRNFFLLLTAVLFLATCDTSSNGTTQAGIPNVQETTKPATLSRDQWQGVDSIFSVLQGVKGKTVADLFADDGYMTFKLIEAGANVIAIETDHAKVDALMARKRELGLTDQRLSIRKVEPGDPGIAMEEADLALMMHHFVKVPHVTAFIGKVRAGLKKPKTVAIIDFLRAETPIGPPLNERLSAEQVMDSMDVLFITDVGAYTQKIPYQYIVIAQDLTMSDEELRQMMQSSKPQ